jgi:hypothetical protein
LNLRGQAIRNPAPIGVGLLVVAIVIAWVLGERIVANDTNTLIFAALGFAACAVVVAVLRNWRTGFYLFLVWMVFEDLVRKYMGNNLALFFGKDALLLFVYLALFLEIRRGKEAPLRPPFLISLSLFFWLAVLQMFNPNSPSILYGLLGLKTYFYYVPLIFVGYALIRTDHDLMRFLTINAILGAIVAAIGITQGIVGSSFLNPAHLDPDLLALGDLHKVDPTTNQIFYLPDSVFVSSGRYAVYLLILGILMMAMVAYLLLYTRRQRKLAFGVLGTFGVAALLSGSRTALLGVGASACFLAAGFLWGAPWRWSQAHRLIRAIRNAFIVLGLSVATLLFLFPQEAGSRLGFFSHALGASDGSNELADRTWDYPIANLFATFDQPNWMMGNGTGTVSLGRQYVPKLLGGRQLTMGVEEGYGSLTLEMGIAAPFLWIAWTASLLYYSWNITRGLRETRLFPIALAITWYEFMLLYPLTYFSLASYQNYTCNVYLWLLVGILFRLPEILTNTQSPVIAYSAMRAASVGAQI